MVKKFFSFHRKKDECKLEWMYKGPNNQVNREEYLLGRSIDKTFEQVQEAEKSSLRAGIGEHDKCKLFIKLGHIVNILVL